MQLSPAAEAARVPVPERTSAAERAYGHLKRGILDRSYPGGSVVTEGEVAEDVGVSRTPVREALLRLQAEGLVHLQTKRGALVLAVTAAEARDVLEARELVESWAAPRALAARDRLLPIATGHVEAMRAARAAGDAPALVEADRAFHEAVVEAAGNEVLARLYSSLRDRQLRMGVATMEMSSERQDRAVAEHERLLAALVAGDERFVSLTTEHVHTARSLVGGAR